MASSRKSRNLNKQGKLVGLQAGFERALGEILARVCISAGDEPPACAIAYSGGLDSSVLLRLAHDYAAAHGVSLHAFHVHHGLSCNADAWLAHCAAEAGKLNLPFSHRVVSIAGERRNNLEESARIARYAALGEMCREQGIRLLLTAHHRDDQAETVLLQLLRGAGLPGLSGMAELQQDHPLLGAGIALGRPLLSFARSELDQAADGLALAHVIDESNVDARYRRNALRHHVAPALGKYFSGYAAAIARSAVHAQAAQRLAHDMAEFDLQTCSSGPAHAALDLPRLNALACHRADNLLRHWLQMHGVQAPSAARLTEIRLQTTSAQQDMHPVFDFGALRLCRSGRWLELQPALGAPPSEALVLSWRGEREISVPQWHGKVVFEEGDAIPGIDAHKLRHGALSLCPRSGRERLKLAANRPSRTLKNLFQEHSIPVWKRHWLPLLYLDNELLYAAGLGMDVRHVMQAGGVRLRWISDQPALVQAMPEC